MRTPSAAVLPTLPSIASRGLSAVLLGFLAAPAFAETRLTLQPGGEADRLMIESAQVVPLLRGVSGRFSVQLPEPAPPLAVWPRGMTAIERLPRGFAFDLSPGIHLLYRVTPTGPSIDVVHRQGGGPPPAPAPAVVAQAGPMPARQVSVGLIFTAPRLAVVRLGPESVLLVLPPGSDLDLGGLPPRPVKSAEEVVQGRYRLIRLGLDVGAGLEVVREGQGAWRLGFAAAMPARRLSPAFAEDGRSARLTGLGAGVEGVLLRLPELGPVGMVLTDEAVGVGRARSPYLDLFETDVGALVIPRTENVVMVKDGSALVISAVDQSR